MSCIRFADDAMLGVRPDSLCLLPYITPRAVPGSRVLRCSLASRGGGAHHAAVARRWRHSLPVDNTVTTDYSPSEKHRHELRTARIEVAHAVARETCDSLSGNARDICRNEAKGAYLAAKGEAELAEQSAIGVAARDDAAAVRRDAV